MPRQLDGGTLTVSLCFIYDLSSRHYRHSLCYLVFIWNNRLKSAIEQFTGQYGVPARR